MGAAGWIAVGLGGWLLAGFWLAHAFGRAAKDGPEAARHEPEVLRRRQRQQPEQHIAVAGQGSAPADEVTPL
jgi:hypothetical protein